MMLICAFLLHGNVLAESQKPKIAILPFQVQGSNFETEDMGNIISEWLITAFVKDGRFEVIERKLLADIIGEQEMIEAGIVTQEAVSKSGKLQGVKAIISGSVMKLNNVVEVNARIFDVASALIIAAENVKSDNMNELQDLVVEMAGKIIKTFPLEGLVAYRDKKEVMIDLGKRAGVRPGMMFRTYREGEAVKHPKSGEVLFVREVRTGTIQIFNVRQKVSEGIILEEESTGAIQSADFVKSLKEEDRGDVFKAVERQKKLDKFQKLLRKAETAIDREQLSAARSYLSQAERMNLGTDRINKLRQELALLEVKVKKRELTQSAEANYEKGKAAEQEGRLREALQLYETAESKANGAGIQLPGLVGRLQDVRQKVQKDKKLAQSAENSYTQGKRAEKAGRFAESLQMYEKAKSQAHAAGIKLSGLDDSIRRVEKKILEAKQLKKNAEKNFAKGIKAEEKGKWQEALNFYTAAESQARSAGISLTGLTERMQDVRKQIKKEQEAATKKPPRRRIIGSF